MRKSGCAVLVASLLLLASASSAEPATSKAKTWSFPIAADARALIAPLSTAELLDDARFIQALTSLLRSDLSAESQADAFLLMTERIGWLFAGSVRLFPSRTYFETFGGMAGTWFEYQAAIEPLKLDAGPLLAVAEREMPTNVMRGSHALLLATLVDRSAAGDSIERWIDADRIAAVPESAIALHHIALAAALTRDLPRVALLAPLLETIPIEEGREDVLCAVGLYKDPAAIEIILTDVIREIPLGDDQSVITALHILHQRLPPATFSPAWDALLSSVENDERRLGLKAQRAKNFRSLTDEAWTKIWDGFDIVIYDDGMQLKFGDFSYFRSNSPAQ